jgi:hypothetical protein
MYIGLHVKYPLSLSDFNKVEFSRQISNNYKNIKFHENLYTESWVVPYGQTDRNYKSSSRFSQFWEHAQKIQRSDRLSVSKNKNLREMVAAYLYELYGINLINVLCG